MRLAAAAPRTQAVCLRWEEDIAANNRLGGSKLAFIAVLLAVALVVLAYVFLTGEPQPPETTASAPAQQQEQSNAAEAPQTQSAPRAEGRSPTATPEEPEQKRKTITRGDTTSFSLSHGDIGYVDVASILQDRNAYSILALLQSHKELTAAGDFLEIEIIYTPRENEIWGYQAYFQQLIDGEPTNEVGSVLFSADGAVGRLSGRLVNPESLSVADLLILRPEAEAIAREGGDSLRRLPIGRLPFRYGPDYRNSFRHNELSKRLGKQPAQSMEYRGLHRQPEMGRL